MSSAKTRLIIQEFSLLAIPDDGGMQDGLKALMNIGKGDSSLMKQATKNVEAYIAAVKSAPDNPYKTDEEICEEILRQVEAKKK